MGWLDKIFGSEKKPTVVPPSPSPTGNNTVPASPPQENVYAGLEDIHFGHYNDNNKSYQKTQVWHTAEERFKEKNYTAAYAAFFDYITDEEEHNVIYRPDGDSFTFELIQGSKKITGECDGKQIIARAAMARMETPSTAVMRRLLDVNYALYYSRCAIDEHNTLWMLMDTSVEMAAPSKLYYSLRELATKADRLDDLLLADFPALQSTNTEHMQPLPEKEMEVKYTYFRQWIEDALTRAAALNQDSFSGSVAYIYLSLIYRIDFLIVPEAKLLADLEEISSYYWNKKEEIALVERNQKMLDGVRKLLDVSRETFAASVYRSRGTFAVAMPPNMEKVKENMLNANKDAQWYIDNKYRDLALVLNEYGITYNQFAYSMPRLMKELSVIYMAVLYSDFFKALGMKHRFYKSGTAQFNRFAIEQAVDEALRRFPDKYVDLSWDANKVKYESLNTFAATFSEQMTKLNMEHKK